MSKNIRNRTEIMEASTMTFSEKLASYDSGYNHAKMAMENGVEFESLVNIADNSELASDEFYAGMLAALFPCKALFIID